LARVELTKGKRIVATIVRLRPNVSLPSGDYIHSDQIFGIPSFNGHSQYVASVGTVQVRSFVKTAFAIINLGGIITAGLLRLNSHRYLVAIKFHRFQELSPVKGILSCLASAVNAYSE